MEASIVSSIVFVLLFIILILFVDGKVFAAQMEHRKLGGATQTMTMRRNLEENGRQSSKIGTSPSRSRQNGQKNTQHKPDTRPNQATAQGKNYVTYQANQRNSTSFSEKRKTRCPFVYTRCKLFLAPEPSQPPSSSKDTQGLGH